MWTEIDDVAAEVEMGDMLYGLVRMLKPALVVETGTYHGHSTVWLDRALCKNAFGKLVSCDIVCGEAPGVPNIDYRELSGGDHKTFAHTIFKFCSSLNLPELKEADFVFSDSDQNLRQQEFELVKPGCVFVVHDTARSYTTNTNQHWLGDWVKSQGGLTFAAGRGFGIIIKA